MPRSNDAVVLAVSTLCLLFWVSVSLVSAIPPKPVISLDFETTVSLYQSRTNQTIVAVWYQDYENELELFLASLDGYDHTLLNLEQNSAISYNSTNCNWGCYQGDCCNNTESDQSYNTIQAFGAFDFGPVKPQQLHPIISPPTPPSCACIVVGIYLQVWSLYANATYSGTCSVGSQWNTTLTLDYTTVSYSLCYDDTLQAPSSIQLSADNGFSMDMSFSNWNGSSPDPSVFAVPSYCKC
eukprot:TRINITY_DN3675_c0_g1_i1.p1 TRINITY_DN3675_c0_g1~~TRINITY_DN3675_c0_g1_i1.p1  ORF type:complete len:239 (+),score=35.29 TRINITY_DN3675_c0_g1_i1:46-762(+)